jgi:transcriptional regulator with XRE-family HTH domain
MISVEGEPGVVARMKINAREVDAHVGGRVRERREELGMSQGKIARQLGLTFSQVQKYEKGTNRIGAGRLFMLSQTLGVPLQYFFDGLVPEQPTLVADNPDPSFGESREIADLCAAYRSIRDAETRRSVLELVRSLPRDSVPSNRPRLVSGN